MAETLSGPSLLKNPSVNCSAFFNVRETALQKRSLGGRTKDPQVEKTARIQPRKLCERKAIQSTPNEFDNTGLENVATPKIDASMSAIIAGVIRCA